MNHPTNKSKYLQIFNYLLDFSKLRSVPVRDIESSDTQYPEKIWFSDIPQDDIFDCVTFPNHNQSSEYWLQINKPKTEPKEPIFPELTESLDDWVEKYSLLNLDSIPTLKESIQQNNKEIFLADNLNVISEFKTYLNDAWLVDKISYREKLNKYEIEHSKYEKQSKIYKQFFSLYNKVQQFGDEFELVIGIGLLNFKEDMDSPLICRHIFTSKAEITFDSTIRILPSVVNEIEIETDAIIDLVTQFESSNIIDATQLAFALLKKQNILSSPFDPQINDVLQLFSNRIRSDGNSIDEIFKPYEVPKKPTVYFAPALILRKRNTRSFGALYEKIISDINKADDSLNIPSINDLIDTVDEDHRFSNTNNGEFIAQLNYETIYFPKAFNDEQIEIVEKLRRSNKVLVQGPPGTGKSHTIANLICHLLANGKKILVTALTKRALEVLREKLPDDFKNLSVNLLSNDTSSMKDLNASVNAINDEISRVTNLTTYKREIQEKEEELALLRSDRAATKGEWIRVKEQSTRKQHINQNYQGTLTEISERIEKERTAFTWFKDTFTDTDNLSLISEIESFSIQTSIYRDTNYFEISGITLKKTDLPASSELIAYKEIKNKLTKLSNKKTVIVYKDFDDTKKELNHLHKQYSEIEAFVFLLKSQIIEDYNSKLSFWKEKISRTRIILEALQDFNLKDLDRSVQIQYPNDKNLIQLKNDALVLLSYVDKGNTLSGILFAFKKRLLPKDIKEKLYFIDNVTVNGSPCDTAFEFKCVLNDINIKQDFEELEQIWEIKPLRDIIHSFEKFKFYVHIVDDSENLIKLLESSNDLKINIESNSTIKIDSFNTRNIEELIINLEHDRLIFISAVFEETFEKAINKLPVSGSHPVSMVIRNAIEDLDSLSYERGLNDLDLINSNKEKRNSYNQLQVNLRKHFPLLVDDILNDNFNIIDLKYLEDAIYLNHASNKINKLLEKDYETVLLKRIFQHEQKEELLISTIASRKAWLHIIERLTNNPTMQRHLTAWKQAVREIPKTRTSPNYQHYKDIANKEMEFCKQSVACWVMPLYQVVENFIPEPEIFDYVIVDEASQLGPDAVFLFYISKNIIVVGDDKQTAPEHVGIPSELVKTMINKHLKPSSSQIIPYADFYGIKHSFFDHCDRLCAGKKVVLREHFRCMPEIIEFSNRYFYEPEGKALFPLKQYAENHLDPLKSFYCDNGYVEGTNQNIRNTVEADQIVKKIAEIVKDENYFNIEDGIKKPKSIGIICLQGNLQAKLIEGRLMDLIGADEMLKRKIICGSSGSFQGDERDVIFLSMIVAHGHRGIALTGPADERRYNVAVSRAKEQIWLFHSLQLEDLQSKSPGIVDLRYKILDHFQNYKENRKISTEKYSRKMGSQPSPFESWFEVDVHNDIIDKGYKVSPAYEVVKGRHRIDLAVILSNGVKIAVECDGEQWHGPEQAWADAGRQRFLERIGGWRFFRIRGPEYYSNRKKSLEPLWRILSQKNDEKAEIYVDIDNQTKMTYSEVVIDEVSRVQTLVKHNALDHVVTPPLPDILNKQFTQLNTERNLLTTITVTKDKPDDNVKHFHDWLIFTNHESVYKTQNKLHKSKKQIISELVFESYEKPIFAANTNSYEGFMIFAFENGKIAKVSLKSYQTESNRKKVKNAINNEAKVIFITQIVEDIDLVAISSIDKIIVFSTNMINAVDNKITKGVQLMKSKDNSKMIKIKKLSHVNFTDPNYYRKENALNVIGKFLKSGDTIHS